ncbi:FKBP-type peptidyl-prolyl cis-trans isomerase [Hymenobacter lapidiphilus]|uniref:FKBP-type peptidyl-prolyl cis-trans isomerase n=1 Tax=Hymenobacter sp. CCM 8763 TaxID=2303334 RepID=UPI001F5B7379|nr:FKBP-type peptidyl-prolyl cis-trans isomerase [Hymenobacter sp. CCM 8763]
MPYSVRMRVLGSVSALLLAAAGLVSFQGKPVPFNRLKSGLEYRIYRLEKGRYVLRPALPTTGDPTYAGRVGRILSLHLQFRTAKDSVLMHSRRQNESQPVRVPLDTLRPNQGGSVEQALALLQPGDSGVFRLNIDTVFSKSFRQPVPGFIRRAGPTMLVFAKAVSVQTPAEVEAQMRQEETRQQETATVKAAEQARRDEALILAYAKERQLQPKKTPRGVYYVVTRPGSGPVAQPGQTVSVLYRGQLLSGQEFDASANHGNKPIEFPLGAGRVIPGWDEGLAQLSKGAKATLLIPSALAYGPRSPGESIPANSVLLFDVELVDVK